MCAVACALGTNFRALCAFRQVARRMRGLVDSCALPMLADVPLRTADMLALMNANRAYRARLLVTGRATLLGHATELARMPRSASRDAILEAMREPLARSLGDATVDGRPMYAHADAGRVIARLLDGGYPRLRHQIPDHIGEFMALSAAERVEYAHGPICVWDTSVKWHASTEAYHARNVLPWVAPLQWSSDLFWETGAFVSTAGLFYRNAEFHGSLATWNVRRVVTMESMFEHSGIVDSGVGAWDTRSLRTAGKMFSGAMNLHPGFDLSRWNVSQLVDLHSMFRRSSIVHAGLAAWALPPDAEAHRAVAGAPNFRADTLRSWRRDLALQAVLRVMI